MRGQTKYRLENSMLGLGNHKYLAMGGKGKMELEGR